MPSLAAVISAIIGGCVLLTLILSYAIWSIHRDQAQIQRQWCSQQCTDRYALQLFERNQRRAQPKPTRLRTPSPLYETRPFSEEVRIAFPPGLNKDAASSVSQNLTEVCISEELKIVEIAEEIVGILGVSLFDFLKLFHFPYPIGTLPYPFRHWFIANHKSPSPQGQVIRLNPKQYGLWSSVVFRSRVVAGSRLSFGEGRG
ncbi:hypothetical protein OBBRIDRAFT_806391 [Obba rivulosa]|uniref:Uncharacterized protein n=1 Tax=Obba rivulosa TaxID=1052685 RepID=A0A8E2AMJ0_9APHY|nr:hypothetical protein OBBRIDRAFT_806391 [Obba rivulosa]